MSTYVLGDIQGCNDELQQLLTHIGFEPDTDVLWAAGDMINRGPDNVGVMDTLMSLPNVQCVLGNHDLHFLAVANGQQNAKRKDTFHDLLNHARCSEYVDWLQTTPLAYYNEHWNSLMVHAGVPTLWSLQEVLTLAAEVEGCLQSKKHKKFLKHMYGNEPAKWRSDLTGMERLRVITNYLTRIRFAKQSGKVNLTNKTEVAPPGYSPWFDLDLKVHEGTDDDPLLLFGHWAALGGVDQAKVQGLDTGCVWGRHLTALRLDDGVRFTMSAGTEHQEVE